MKKMSKLIVSDGDRTLVLERDRLVDPWTVTSPFFPGIVTESHTVEGAFGYFEDAIARNRNSKEEQYAESCVI